jgi:hypothetical protein
MGSILTSSTPTPIVPGSDLGRIRVEWWREDEPIYTINRMVQPPFLVDHIAVSPFKVPTPEQPGTYVLKVINGVTRQEVASGLVTLVEDTEPPETTLLPVRSIEANLVCDAGTVRVDVLMQTIGWYDEAFTLSGRLLDENGIEVARSAADVEFPSIKSRQSLLYTERYSLPFDSLPPDGDDTLRLQLLAYAWQQVSERIVARGFVEEDGTVTNSIQLPIKHLLGCDL